MHTHDSCVAELLLLLLLLVVAVMVVINIIITDHHYYYHHHHSLFVFSGTRRFPCLFALVCPSFIGSTGWAFCIPPGRTHPICVRRTTEYTTTADFFNDGERNFGFTLPQESQEAARSAAQIGSVRHSSSSSFALLPASPLSVAAAAYLLLERLRVRTPNRFCLR